MRSESMLRWSELKPYGNLDTREFREWHPASAKDNEMIVCVSHRWLARDHPDPKGAQLHELQQRLQRLEPADLGPRDTLVFLDYCALPQKPRSRPEDETFRHDLELIHDLFRRAAKVVVLSEGYAEYKDRAWCFIEAVMSENRIHFFDDQDHIKGDLAFLGNLMAESIPQITAFDMSYKVHMREAEVISASFHHLGQCSATDPEDLPRIKNMMVTYFNSRRLRSFGRLLVAVNKFFESRFALLPTSGATVIDCRPYFEAPAWPRLPGTPDLIETLLQVPRQPSIFAVPPEEGSISQGTDQRSFYPVLDLSRPGEANYETFLKSFQSMENWPEFVVNPIGLGLTTEDRFPEISYVIHTILERPPAFFGSRDWRKLYLPLVDP